MMTNPVAVAAAISALVTVLGALFTFFANRRSSTDHRIDLLLDQLTKDNVNLRARMDTSEADRLSMHRDMLALRVTLSEQSAELYLIRSRETDLRAWARDVMAWCALAIGVIHGLNGSIPDPPPVPHTYNPESEENPQ